ncbi:MAG: PHP-associated domain-containing protein [Candidatus Hydrothermarchaeaceae archaeon]
MKIDTHICTTYSKHPDENPASPQEAVRIAIKRGLEGIVIADHDTLNGGKEAKELAPRDFLVIVGNEISAKEGHIVLLGVDETIKRDTPLSDILDIARDYDGLVILPHPNITSMESSICEPLITKHRGRIDVCHLFSTRHLLFYRTFKRVVKTHGFTPVGCSYAHNWYEIGTIFTEFDELGSEDDFIYALKKGEVGKTSFLKTPSGFQNIARSNLKVIRKFFYWRRYYLRERVPVYYRDILKAIDEKEDFTLDEIKSYLNEIRNIPDVEKDLMSLLTLQETLKYLERRGTIKGNEGFHLNRDQTEYLSSELDRLLFYRVSLRYFYDLIFG